VGRVGYGGWGWRHVELKGNRWRGGNRGGEVKAEREGLKKGRGE